MMNVLCLTPQLPYPPMQGTSLRNFYLIRELARRHQISLLTFLQPGDSLGDDSPLRDICHAIHAVPAPARRSLLQRALTSLASPLPDMALRLPSEQMTRTLCDWIRREAFDVLQVEGIEMASYALALKAPPPLAPAPFHGRGVPRLVFDDHNAEYVLQRSAFQSDMRKPTRWHGALYSWVQWQKLMRYERRVLLAHDAIAAVSQADARALQRLAPHKEIVVVPNGVDTQEYAPPPQPLPRSTGEGLVFTGKMDYRPNVDAALWFAQEILPGVRTELPQARFVIVGQQPHARLTALQSREDVVLTGRVDDVRPYIARAAVYVAPLRMGGGTRLKVLQAMSMAASIVSTTLGCEGLAVQSGREVLLADTPRDFAAAVIRLVRDSALRQQLGAHARQKAVEQYDWQRIAPLMEQAYFATRSTNHPHPHS